ncbi:MAG TPA: glycosyltransferase family 4 protein [Acidimicrobiales bacterium]|nr:glycosyltransferase family 4 protein [Acidimicrobiales bacterium]
MTAVHQFVPMLHRADAVGRHTLRLREVFEARGVRSEVYVELVDPETAAITRPFTQYAEEAEPGDIVVYQFATASRIAPYLRTRREPLVLNYHNVTPPEYYAPWNNAMARHQLRAQQELGALARRAQLGIAVSSFNEMELEAAGCARTAVVPPAAALPLHASPRPAAPAPDTRSGGRWISVGRVAPNKGIELAVMGLLVARAHHDPGATLEVIGRPAVAAYSDALDSFVDEMGLHGAVRFTGPVSDAALATAMARADVLVLSSRHEGFGVPALEAMGAGLPVVANRAGALPEVIGDAGVLVDATDPYELAAAVARVAGDEGLRRTLAGAGERRLRDLDLPSAGERAADLILALGA